MPEQFLHGVEVVEISDGTRPVRTVKSSVFGFCWAVTEDQATALAGLDNPIALNSPVLLVNQRAAAKKLGDLASILSPFYSQVNSMAVVTFVQEGADETATVTGMCGDPTERSGVWALLSSQAECGVIPRLIAAGPAEYASADLAAELVAVATQLKGMAYVDMPCSIDALTDMQAFRENLGSERAYLIGNYGVDNGSNVSGAMLAAGVTAKIDNDYGFWNSPSNREILGISGVKYPHDYIMGNPNSAANFLNEHDIATIIREDGFRLWGNRTCSGDPKWAFLSVRRTADMINESLLYAHLWAVDRNITKNYVDEVKEGVNSYLRHLKAVGAILGGECYLDPEINTPDQIKQGKVYFDFDFTPPYPAEHVTFRSHLVDNYIEEIFI